MGELVQFYCTSCNWEGDRVSLGGGMVSRPSNEKHMFECIKCGVLGVRKCSNPRETKRRFQCSQCRGKMVYFDHVLRGLEKKPCVSCGKKALVLKLLAIFD